MTWIACGVLALRWFCTYSTFTFLLPQGIINFAITPSSGEEDSTKSRHYLEKFAFSNAMAASVKLGALETSLDKIIDSIEFLSEDMKEGRPFATSR